MSAISQMLMAYGAIAYTYATWNPSDKAANITLSNGNKTVTAAVTFSDLSVRSTLYKSSGTGSFSTTITNPGFRSGVGIALSSATLTNQPGFDGTNSIAYRSAGNIYFNSSLLATVTALSAGDVVRVDFDKTAGTISFYRNGVLQYTASGANVPSGNWYGIDHVYDNGGGVSHTTDFTGFYQ